MHFDILGPMADSQREPASSRPLDDPLEEALRLIGLADDRGLCIRLLGGLAIRARAQPLGGRNARSESQRQDIDLATVGGHARAAAALLAGSGYEADTHYNALYGHKQLYFVDPIHDRPVDIVIDVLEMCHRLDFRDRLALDHPTLPLADLLLSKLQVVQFTTKDGLDALTLLAHFPLADTDAAGVNVARILHLTSTDWGWWRTVTANLANIGTIAASRSTPDAISRAEPFDAATQVAALLEAIEQAPKSPRWRLRSRIGDRVRWYEEPEETTH